MSSVFLSYFPFQVRDLRIQFIDFLLQLLHGFPVLGGMPLQPLYLHELVFYFFLLHLSASQFLVICKLVAFDCLVFAPFSDWFFISLARIHRQFRVHRAILHNVDVDVLAVGLRIEVFDLGERSAWSRLILNAWWCSDGAQVPLVTLYLMLESGDFGNFFSGQLLDLCL